MQTASTLDLKSKKVVKSTSDLITKFLHENRTTLSNELKLFYYDVRNLLDFQLTKKKARRMSMNEILERSYNIDKYILAAGAISVETEFVNI